MYKTLHSKMALEVPSKLNFYCQLTVLSPSTILLLVDFISLLNDKYSNFIINNEYISYKFLNLLDVLIKNIILQYDNNLTKSEMILAIGGIKNYLYLMLYHPDDFNNEDVKDDINNYLDKLYINKTYRGD